MMKRLNWLYVGALAVLASCAPKTIETDNLLTVDYSQKGAEVNPKMYGIFFEEINHSGDGSLYAELVRNRNFEEHVLPSGMTYKDGHAHAPHSENYMRGGYSDWKIRWDADSLKMIGWSVTGQADYDVVSERPLHPNTPNAMKLQMKEAGVVLANEGYWGLPVVGGDKYDLRFYVNAADYPGNVTAKVVSAEGVVLSETPFEIKTRGEWQEYTAEITPNGTDYKGFLQLVFDAPGTVYVDYVSLFPQKTFKGRKNGMRADVAQLLADLKPGFVRWPGGCIAEGATYENRVKWQETLGDPMTRHSEWILWNYHCTWGFGYHEFLQFCEDIGADAMFVANVGLSCGLRNGDFTTDLDAVVQDIRNAIEYAMGDKSTTWGAKRAVAGHPEPFKLKYVELGNEQWGDYYAKRYNELYKILKPLYPEITFICTLQLEKSLELLDKADMIDPHWYVDPAFFYDNTQLFDNQERGKYDIYVGEYAVNRGVGAGNMDAALAEASFISGMERNSDLVKIASYAPLIENSNHRDWATNLIWVNSEKSLGRSSYYVQQMYGNNVPTYNLNTTAEHAMPSPFNGFIGLGGEDLQKQYRNLKVTDAEGNVIIESNDFTGFTQLEKPAGNFRRFMPTVSLNKNQNVKNAVIEFEACTIEREMPQMLGRNNQNRANANMKIAPSLIFSADEAGQNYFTLNFGSWGRNTGMSLSRTVEGSTSNIAAPAVAEFDMKAGEWYKIRVELNGENDLVCYANGEKVFEAKVNHLDKIHAVSGYDEATGETIIKMVNATGEPFTTNVALNCAEVQKNGTVITLAAESLKAENSFDEPKKISPVTTSYNHFDKNFQYTFAPYSFTILRIKTSDK